MNAPDKTVEVSQAARELEPCPFCGGEAKTFGPYGWYSQWGISHSCKTFYNGSSEICQGFGSANAAIAAWNTRATQPEAALREALEELEWCRTEIFSLCESIEDDPILEKALEGSDHERGYARGQMKTAKSVRNAMAEVLRVRIAEAKDRAALKDHRHG